MTLKWQDLIAVAIVVAAVVWFLRPRAKKPGCGCSKPAAAAKPAPSKPAHAVKTGCSGGIALCGGR